MSILPLFDESSRLFTQQFGLALTPENVLQTLINPRITVMCPAEYPRNCTDELHDTGSTVSIDKDAFHVNIDVQQFTSDEISVNVTDDRTITIEGKHEDKQDEHGYISRHFVRKYTLPSDCDINRVQSTLSSDGILTIAAPKLEEKKSKSHREIPIIRTGEPLKKVEQKSEE